MHSDPTPRQITRRPFLGALAASAVLGAGSPSASAAPTAGRRPNILLIVVDDLGWGEVGAYGQKVIKTPVLDQLAADGVRFSQAYATPTCAPTRASLFTGLHTGHCRVKQNSDAGTGFTAEDVVVPELLKKVGYRTAIIGKYGFGTTNPTHPSHPNNQGFDHFFGYIGHGAAHDYWPTVLWRNGEKVSYPENANADVTYAGTEITNEALWWIDQQSADTPFFLDVSYTTPHAPNEHPSQGMYAERNWPEGEKNHAAQVTWTDAQVGVLLERLERRGLGDHTLVVFVSDNGPHKEGPYAHVGSTTRHDPEFFDSNGGLRGIKRDVYEGGIRVPMIARVPATWRRRARRGTVVDTPLAVWDFLPTFAEVAGVRVTHRIDGLSFAPALRGERTPRHDYLYWQFPENTFDEAVRFGPWKAVRQDRGTTELYRLDKDLGETTNVARAHPALVARAERLMARSVR